MFEVTDIAKDELQKVFAQEAARGKELVLYFQGYGWSGPNLGMALEESTEGLEQIESNSITAYIDPKLKEYVASLGKVTIDYVSSAVGGGYRIMIGDGCDSGSCGGC